MSLRALEDPTTLDEFLETKAEIERLNAKLDTLKAEILAALMDEPDQMADYMGFRLTIGTRRSGWSYSDEVKETEKVLKARQKYERETGEAVPDKVSSYVIVKPIPFDSRADDGLPFK